MKTTNLYYDLGSPYSYLAFERAADVLGQEPRLRPVLVGGIFRERGYGSWGETDERSARIEEIEARADRYGLPRMTWPDGWPNHTLKAMRATTWAQSQGRCEEFTRIAFRRAFADGVDLSRIEALVDIADAAGLPSAALEAAIEEQRIKDALRETTAEAWAKGVVGVPCLEVDGQVFFGDDRLEEAREQL
jgi:2-hydroxychromene-2-carboxylate isomerase